MTLVNTTVTRNLVILRRERRRPSSLLSLTPAIHVASQSALQLSMDHRVEPGGDESVQPRLKNYTARSRFCAVVRLAKVPDYAVDGVRGLTQDP